MDKDTIADLFKQGEAEQRFAAMREVARALAVYREELICAGFPSAEAFVLTRDYHGFMWAQRPRRGEGE